MKIHELLYPLTSLFTNITLPALFDISASEIGEGRTIECPTVDDRLSRENLIRLVITIIIIIINSSVIIIIITVYFSEGHSAFIFLYVMVAGGRKRKRTSERKTKKGQANSVSDEHRCVCCAFESSKTTQR